MDIGVFPNHQINTIDYGRHKDLLTASVSEVNVNTSKNFFNSGLNWRLLNVWQFLYCPVILMSSLGLWNKRKATQPESFRVTNYIVLN